MVAVDSKSSRDWSYGAQVYEDNEYPSALIVARDINALETHEGGCHFSSRGFAMRRCEASL